MSAAFVRLAAANACLRAEAGCVFEYECGQSAFSGTTRRAAFRQRRPQCLRTAAPPPAAALTVCRAAARYKNASCGQRRRRK